MPLTPGSLLENRYRVDALLGQGGMGAVNRAWDTRLEQWVALKENALATPEARAQFEREAKILARLHHSNLPKVIDHFMTHDGLQYLVMSYIDGINLAELLATRGRQSPADVMAWLGQVCDALTYLHNQNPPIIHRDVKPQNIKITPDGQVFLVDFGLSKVGVQQRTATGALGVTPGFSPPEQYGDNAHTDQASDVYALTATLYAMLTGVVPPDSVQRTIGRALLPPLRQTNPAIPAALEQAVLAGLETQPDRRTPTVAALRQQVTAALSPDRQEITAATPLPPTTRLPPAVSTQTRIRPWMLLFVGAFVTVLLALALWLVRRSSDVTQSPTTIAEINVAGVMSPSPTMTPIPALPNVQAPTPARQLTLVPSPTTPVPPTATIRPVPTLAPTSAPIVFPASSAEQIMVVSLDRAANANTNDGYIDPPRGNVSFAGVPFYLGQGESVTTQAASLPNNPTRISLPVNASPAEAVYLLLTGGNLFNRFAGQPVGRVRLLFDDSKAHTVDLVAGRNVREWKHYGDVVDRASSPELVEVWHGANRFDSGAAVIDMLRIAVPADLQTGRLTGVEVFDLSQETVGDLDPALNLLGISVAQPPTPTATPTETVCRIAAAEVFQDVWLQQRMHLGCALNPPTASDAATERFEHGRMIWRQSDDMIYVLYDDGDWAVYPDTSVDGAPEPNRYTPPAGLSAPIRGFGSTWRTELGGPDARIGWATEAEYGLPVQSQDFEAGLMLEMEGKVYVLGDNGERWSAP